MKTIIFAICLIINTSFVFAQNHVAKIQIQGDDMKKMVSETWDKGYIITKQEGVAMLNRLWDMLTPSEKKEREDAYYRARDFITNSPDNGRMSTSSWSQSFQDSGRKTSNARIDLEIYRGGAFSNDRHITYIRIIGADLSSNMSWSYDEKYIVSQGKALDELDKLWSKLDRSQKDARENAYKEAVSYIKSAPDNGFTGSNSVKEFTDSKATKGEKL